MKTFFGTVALGVTLVAAPLYALDLAPWGQAGDWTIMTDTNHDNGCLAQASYSDGTMLRMGFQDKGKKGFLATFNPAWKEFKIDRRYPVTYTLDGDTYEGEAHGVEANGMHGAQVHFENVDFMVDLAKKNELTFFYKGAEVVKIDLKGSDEALKQVLACQTEQNS